MVYRSSTPKVQKGAELCCVIILVLEWCRYVPLKACISRLPENGYGGNITTWPARLHHPPDRLQSIKMDAFLSRNDIYKAESKYWNEITFSYVNVFRWKTLNVRNVMDMRARYGGYFISLLVASLVFLKCSLRVLFLQRW